MIIAALDFETTGLDKHNDRVIELGVALYSTGHRRFLDSVGQLVKSDVLVTPEVTGITKIQPSAVTCFGYEDGDALGTVIEFIGQADAVIGHNIREFDWPMLQAWVKRVGGLTLEDKLVVDTFEDLPYGVKPGSLVAMCAEAGFLLADAHSALADAQGSLKLGLHYNIDVVVERAKMQTVVVQSLAPRNMNSENKKFKFRWAPAPYKIWWKAVKESDVELLAREFPFSIAVLDKSISLEQLRDS